MVILVLHYFYWAHSVTAPEGRPGDSDVSLLSGISGLSHYVSSLVLLAVLPSPVALLFLSFCLILSCF